MRLSLLSEDNNILDIVQKYLSSETGRRLADSDCKTVTRAFINWASQNGVKAQAIHLAPPSAEFVKSNPQFKGKSGTGDGHIMPVVNGYAIDFTVRQFGVNKSYNDPLITPIKRNEECV